MKQLLHIKAEMLSSKWEARCSDRCGGEHRCRQVRHFSELPSGSDILIQSAQYRPDLLLLAQNAPGPPGGWVSL